MNKFELVEPNKLVCDNFVYQGIAHEAVVTVKCTGSGDPGGDYWMANYLAAKIIKSLNEKPGE